ncbi:MAG TPA: ABC transporter permease [Bryobacteraceae bacterium]|nr:ABC transporter permease [Bryobacteraceae bacterium]
MRRTFARLASFLFRGRLESELAREVASHLALLEEEFERRGMSAKEARLAALRAYGGVEQAKELHRDARSFVWLEQLLQDLRHAIRGLAKSPGFVAVAVLSLAFGIGVNTAIFTLVNGILLKQLPVAEPERIVQLQASVPRLNDHLSGFSYPVFRELSAQTAIFAKVAGFTQQSGVLDLAGTPHELAMQLVTGQYFSLFGGRPVLGRLLGEEDNRVVGAPAVCVLSYRAWQTYLNGDPHVLNRTIRVDGKPFEVVGVVAPEFTGAELQEQFDLWAPTTVLPYRDSPNYIWIRTMARLAPGVSFAEARARLEAASAGIESRLPKDRANAEAVYRVTDGSKGYDRYRNDLRDPLVILMGAVTMVLLVACANLANLLLARAHERVQEFAIKLALGVSRWRLVRQLLLEAFLLTLGGGLAAVFLAYRLNDLLLGLFNAGNRYQAMRVAPDARVLLYTLAGCFATALIAGLYPAWQASRTDAGPGLKGSSGDVRRSFVRRGLILVQVTLAVVLLFGASLFTHSLRKLKSVNLGYDIDRVLTVELNQSGPRFGSPKPRVSALPVLANVLARVRQIPNVESAALTDASPLSGMYINTDVSLVEGRGERREVEVARSMAGQGYFSTLRMPLLQGRDFSTADRAGSRTVVIINQRFAAQLGIEHDAIGKHLDGLGFDPENAGGNEAPQDVVGEIVGIVGNSRNRDVREEALPMAYVAFEQARVTGGDLLIRYRGPSRQLESAVRQIVKTEAPGYQVSDSITMELLRDNLLSQDRLLTFLSALFGVLGTALALVGIYGLIAYSVTRRTREIGIRISIGAQRGHVLWLFLRESILLLCAGAAIGTPLALVLARFIRKMLFDLSPSSGMDIAVTLALLAAGGLMAALAPGRRAMRVDPVRALRYD